MQLSELVTQMKKNKIVVFLLLVLFNVTSFYLIETNSQYLYHSGLVIVFLPVFPGLLITLFPPIVSSDSVYWFIILLVNLVYYYLIIKSYLDYKKKDR